MLVSYAFIRNFLRVSSSSVRSSPESFDAAFKWLLETASSSSPSDKDVRIFEQERPWAMATPVVVHGEPERLDRRANCVIRWVEHPERNLNIELDPRDNSYTVQVKAVYYAVINAMFHRASHVLIYSPNDVVVKVGNGTFKAKKEIEMFDAIRRRAAKSGINGDTCVRLRLLNNEILQSIQKKVEDDTNRKSVPAWFTEKNFRKRYFNEIARI
ncbi:unnamed protein product [Haemonchus placei]|uniref:Mitochondrial ribosomal protein L58 n=1 Tax=Haemonchus placei TaxID=6290 RepID=A0A0N4WQP5_HAEPC|nr:unnamed protein product [Haemonchus placei]